MKFSKILVLILMVTASLAWATGYKNVTAREAKTFLEKSRNAFLLDVRTVEEYRQARLEGAVLIPINEIERRLREIPKTRPVVVYCAVGSRSNLVAGFLAQQGYSDVYNITDGIVGWYRNGYSIVR